MVFLFGFSITHFRDVVKEGFSVGAALVAAHKYRHQSFKSVGAAVYNRAITREMPIQGPDVYNAVSNRAITRVAPTRDVGGPVIGGTTTRNAHTDKKRRGVHTAPFPSFISTMVTSRQ